MENKYILGIDQSTQGTKAVLFDSDGRITGKSYLPHEQLINGLGWVEHDPEQIYGNVKSAVRLLLEQSKISAGQIAGIGITNQRETAVVWDKYTGTPLCNAIVWQCARGAAICNRLGKYRDIIQSHTGLHLSPYFSAAKIAWVLENVPGAKEKSVNASLCYGTIDTWLLYKLTNGKSYKTDYSNASRTQLFNIMDLTWDTEICELFGINPDNLAQVCDSNADFGETDFEGSFENKVPIHCMLGDSHGALFGQRCVREGMIKATYGTGSSIMMNIGSKPVFSDKGIVTSLAWGMDHKVEYVLEGNINYSGAVISWLKNDLKLIQNSEETETLACQANKADRTYLVPAFSGLGAPYWLSEARAILCGMTRITGQAEIVKAALESIAYQITDIIRLMSEEARIAVKELRVDGGPTRNRYLMQFQSDMLGIPVLVPEQEELSVIGAALMAGITMGVCDQDKLLTGLHTDSFHPLMEAVEREGKYRGWKEAIALVSPNTR